LIVGKPTTVSLKADCHKTPVVRLKAERSRTMTRMTVAKLALEVEAQQELLEEQAQQNAALSEKVGDLVDQVGDLVALLSNVEDVESKPKSKTSKAKSRKSKTSTKLPKGASRKIKTAFGKAAETDSGGFFEFDEVKFAIYHEGDWTWIASNPKPDDDVIEKLRSETGARWSSRREAHYVQSKLTAKAVQDALTA
jgi:hypothetical protein